MKAQDKIAQQKANSSAHTVSSKAIQKKAVGVVQKVESEEEVQQHKSEGTVQKMDAPELDEEHPAGVMQHKAEAQAEVIPAQLKENKTGMPDNLKSGIENLSGMSMDHVKVHYNSSQPAQLHALAYAQGSDIHIGPGQEKHLPHEAWHVVQQAQGRVQPTTQMKAGVAVNDDPGLEHEADVMGEKALSAGKSEGIMSGVYQNKSNLLVAQMMYPSHVKITGLSHLVKMDSNGSIFESEDELEVTHGQDVIIDLDREHISRRGPNQEVHRDEDEQGDAIYRWVKVLSVDGKELDDYFIREDAFVIVPLFDKIETDKAISHTYENARNLEEIVALEDLSERLPDAPLDFQLGKQVAKGGTSTLHDIENHPNLLVKKGGGRLSAEALGLIRMEMVGLPTVYVAQRDNCLVVTKLEIVGSKELLGRGRKPEKIEKILEKEDSNYITQKTIDDLYRIWEILKTVPVNIGDFQFLICKGDGTVVLNDPVSVTVGAKPSGKILALIEKVKAIFVRKTKLKQEQDKTVVKESVD